MKATALGTIKRGYAAGAQATGRLLERVGILGEKPPPRHDRLRHWAYSLTKAHDSIGIAELDVPWWTYGAIDEVERWLASREGDVRHSSGDPERDDLARPADRLRHLCRAPP